MTDEKTKKLKLDKKKLKLQEKRRQELLEKPDLIINIIKEVQKEVSGEEDTIIAEIIIATTRLVKNSIPESTNLLLSDKTGLGKDWTTKKTLEVIIPKEDLCHITKMSKQAFTYWHYKDKNWSWDNKVIHFEDINQELLNCSTFKTMASGDNYAVVTKDQKTIEIPIFGKPCMILTSHHANPKDESLRRFRIGGLNDTKKQTRTIMNKISKKYMGLNNIKKDFVLRSAIQNLKPYKVIIPFAEIIQHFFPDNDIMRTQYRCFLDYICASAVLHQYQREKTKDGKLIATPDDYMVARIVLIYTTSNNQMIPTSIEYQTVLKVLQENNPLTIKELEPKCPYSQRWLYTHMPNLVSNGLVKKGIRFIEKANKNVTTYYIDGISCKMIPTWEEISYYMYILVKKTNKTNKTKIFQQLENWFCTVEVKPTKPNSKKEDFSLVLHEQKIPFNRKELLVFPVLYSFFCERDSKRYKKYYENIESVEDFESLNGKIQGAIKIIKDNPDNNFELVEKKYGQVFIEKCLEQNIFNESILGVKLEVIK